MYKGLFKRNISVILTIAIIVSFLFVPVRKIYAIPVVDVPDTTVNTVGTIEQTISTVWDNITGAIKFMQNIDYAKDRWIMPAMKVAAVIAVHTAVQALIGGGNNGGPQYVTNWNKYLYLTPQQRSMNYMTSFFNSVSQGRLGRQNFEGVGQRYDSYLTVQAANTIQGNECVTNLPQYGGNPSQLFDKGNNKKFMAFFEDCNNPYSYSIIAAQAYQTEFERQQKLQLNEQSSGFLPRKDGRGNILAPATLFASAMEGVDQMGNQLLVNAKNFEELLVAVGARIGAQALEYNFGGAAGEASVTRKANDMSFQFTYNKDSGFGVTAR